MESKPDKGREAEPKKSQVLPYNHDCLIGLKSVTVHIEPLTKDAKSTGLDEMNLKTDVELKLQKHGITINSEDSLWPSADSASLYVIIKSSSTDDSNDIEYYLTVKVKTWGKTWAGKCPKKLFKDTALMHVKELMNDLILDYRALN